MERSLTLVTTIVVCIGIALAIALASVLICNKKEEPGELFTLLKV